jgi:hypothetical protein
MSSSSTLITSITNHHLFQQLQTQIITLLDQFSKLDTNSQLIVIGIVSGLLAGIVGFFTYFIFRKIHGNNKQVSNNNNNNQQQQTTTNQNPTISTSNTNIKSIKIPDTVFKDHGMVLSRPGSATSLVGTASSSPRTTSPRTTSPNHHLQPTVITTTSSPRGSPATSPDSPSTPSRKTYTRTFSLSGLTGNRKRGDSLLLGAAAAAVVGANTSSNNDRRRGDSISQQQQQHQQQNPSPLTKKVIIPDDVDDMDTELRVSVAPWLVQDERLARPLEGFIDGDVSRVSAGEKIDDGLLDNPDVEDEEMKKIKLRSVVAPWIVQADAPPDEDDDVVVITNNKLPESPTHHRSRAGSVIDAAKKVFSPLLGSSNATTTTNQS